MTADYKKKS